VPEPEVTPAAEPIVSADAAAAEPRSPEGEAPSPRASIFDRLFGRKSERAETQAEPTEDAGNASGQPSAQPITLTSEELDRRVQAETDRREAKRQREAVEKAARDRQEAIERKLDPNAPDYDPYAGTEERDKLKREQESAERFTGFLGDIGRQHDAATLDVLTAAIPDKERERIMALQGAGVGLDGRKLIVAEGLKALEKHWKAQGARDAEAKLREDPTFRKRLFAEHRGDVDEPELLPANGSPASGDVFMEKILDDYHAAKGRRR
jgi:hypothetical protein